MIFKYLYVQKKNLWTKTISAVGIPAGIRHGVLTVTLQVGRPLCT